MPTPLGTTDDTIKRPARELLKRIDIGLATGVMAVFISLLALLVAWSQTRLSQQTAKAAVLPILRVEMGHRLDQPPYEYAVRIHNDGVGIARIHWANITQDGEIITFAQMADTIANGRSRANARLSRDRAVGFLPAGNTLTPIRYDWGASRDDVAATLREDGRKARVDTLSVDVCYCSVFEDCWTQRANRVTQPVARRSCGRDGEVMDGLAR